MKRGFLISGCAATIVCGSLAVAAPAAADDDCPYGTSPTHFSGVCVAGASGARGGGAAGGAGAQPPAVNPPSNGSTGTTTLPGSGIATVNGIPCTREHIGTCIGMQQNQPGGGR